MELYTKLNDNLACLTFTAAGGQEACITDFGWKPLEQALKGQLKSVII